MHVNIGLGWNWLAATNALAYGSALLIMAVKSFIVEVLGLIDPSSRSQQVFLGRRVAGGRKNRPIYGNVAKIEAKLNSC
jgi:hypothetical protein